MAYVVARPNGRFEIRESQHTRKGPRARTLATFKALNKAILDHAASRANRPFDAQSVVLSAKRAGAPVELVGTAEQDVQAARSAFVAASRRMARVTASRARRGPRQVDPGTALIELLGFADAVARSQPPRPTAPLAFPVLSRLAEKRIRSGGRRGRAAAPSRR